MEREHSDPQARILSFIESYTRENLRPPTNREIGKEVGIGSTGHVDYHLTVLEKKGFLIRERKKSRGLRLVHGERRGLPIAGTIAAGAPLTDIQQKLLAEAHAMYEEDIAACKTMGAFGGALPLPHEASAKAISSGAARCFTIIRGSRVRSRRWTPDGSCPTRVHRRDETPPSYR